MQFAPAIASENIDIRAARRLSRLLNPVPVFDAHPPGNASRPSVEAYIAKRFRAAHGAEIHDFMPVLLTMSCQGRTSAATGVRSAAGKSLFLEQYLSEPADQAVAAAFDAPVQRARLAEIGNLVASQGGASYLLFLVLTAVLQRTGFEWTVFTATPQVRKGLSYLGLEVKVLCEADPARLTRGSAGDWGRYYASGPQVVAGRVADAMAVLEDRMLYASVLALFRVPIEALAETIGREGAGSGSCTLAA
jgi:hypothetical protein